MSGHALDVRGITKTFRGNGYEVRAVDNVSFRISKGEAVALLGPNGSGKTTTINIISGLLDPDSGTVEMFGRRRGEEEYRAMFSVVNSTYGFYWRLTGRDIIMFYAGLFGRDPESGLSLAEKYGISGILDRKFSSYSQGQKTRLKLVVALMKSPRLLIMDEPTLGLDPEIADSFRKEIRSLKGEMSILITSHYMKDVEEIADRVVFIMNGRVIKAGNLSEFRVEEDEIEIRLSRRFRGMGKLKSLGRLDGLVFVTTRDRLFEALSVIRGNFRSITSREVDIERYFIEVVRGERK